MHKRDSRSSTFSHIITTIALLGVEGNIKTNENSGCFLYCLIGLPNALVCSYIIPARAVSIIRIAMLHQYKFTM